MIRSSEFGSRQPTREVTAQRYQAAVTPAPQKVSGVEKLLDFGMKAAQTKFQWDQEVLQADMTAASEKTTAAIKAMKPADYVKDPEAAWKVAGGDSMYALIDSAPPGAQKMLRKQIDTMKAKAENSMQLTYAASEKVRATVYNTSHHLREQGTITPEMWGNVVGLDSDGQKAAVNAMNQQAITDGNMQYFKDAKARTDLDPEIHDDILRAERQAQNAIDEKARLAAAEQRRKIKEQKEAKKESEQNTANALALQLVEGGAAPQYAIAVTGAKSSVINKAIATNEQLATRVRRGSVLGHEKAQVDAGLQTPSNPDGTMSKTFAMGADLMGKYITANNGDVYSLQGSLLSEHDTMLAAMSQAEADETGEAFAQVLYRNKLTVPDASKIAGVTKDQKAEIQEITSNMTISQKENFTREFNATIAQGFGYDRTLKHVQESIQRGTVTTEDGYVISGLTTITNKLKTSLGVDSADDDFAQKVVVNTVDKTLAQASTAQGKVANRGDWIQQSAYDGTLYFRHIDGGALVAIGTDSFNKYASEMQKADVTTGMSEAEARVAHPEQFQNVGNYSIRKLPGE